MLLSDRLRRDGREHRILAFRGFAAPETRRRADAIVDLLDVQATQAHHRGVAPEHRDPRRRRAPAAAFGVPQHLLGLAQSARARAPLARGDDRLLRSAVELLRGARLPRRSGRTSSRPSFSLRPASTRAPRPSRGRLAPSRSASRCSQTSRRTTWARPASSPGERILAIEGPEGTDSMLARVRGLPPPLRAASASSPAASWSRPQSTARISGSTCPPSARAR